MRYTHRKPRLYCPKVVWAPDMLKWAVQTPFDTEKGSGEEFRTELKLRLDIPPKWDADIKCWLVDERDEKVLKDLLIHYWPSYPTEWGDKPKNTNGHFSSYDPNADDSSFRKLFKLAGPEAATKLWKAAMLSHHPDAGGTDSNAQEANQAWTEIKRQLNW